MDRARRPVTAAALLALVAGGASAHEDRTPKRDAVQLGPSEIVIALDYAVVRGDLARTLRRIFDRDHSGTLDESETARLGAHLLHEATAFLALTVDGKPIALRVGAPVVDAAGVADEAIAIHAEAIAALDLTPGPHTVRLRDRHKDRRLVVPATVNLQPGLTWRARPLPLPILDENHPLDLEIDAR